MNEAKWTPESIGGKLHPPQPPYLPYGSWTFDRVLTKDEVRAVEMFLIDQRKLAPAMSGTLPASHPFKAPRASFDHLAPDHPWRTGTIPAPQS